MVISCLLFGLWCAEPVSRHVDPINSFNVSRQAMADLTTAENFYWDMPCSKGENADYMPYMKGVSVTLNDMERALPMFLHGAVPNIHLRGETVMRFASPSPCTISLGAGTVVVPGIIDFSQAKGRVVFDESTTITMRGH